MKEDLFQKIRSDHLRRKAFIYIRKANTRQAIERQEYDIPQYALKQCAIKLGWLSDNVVIIDDNYGRPAAFSCRKGFKKLVSEVSMGNVGIVISIEASRLARNIREWHLLLEICAATKSIILDKNGIYDPTDFNDRLLLGLKGNMSEMSLHLIRSRLIKGDLLNKQISGSIDDGRFISKNKIGSFEA